MTSYWNLKIEHVTTVPIPIMRSKERSKSRIRPLSPSVTCRLTVATRHTTTNNTTTTTQQQQQQKQKQHQHGHRNLPATWTPLSATPVWFEVAIILTHHRLAADSWFTGGWFVRDYAFVICCLIRGDSAALFASGYWQPLRFRSGLNVL